MSSYSDKQKELENASYALYESINQFTQLINKTGGVITLQAKNFGEKIEDKILNLYYLSKRFNDTHHQIPWAGKLMPSNQLFQMIILVLEEEIEKHTSLRFSKLDGILRDKSPYQKKSKDGTACSNPFNNDVFNKAYLSNLKNEYVSSKSHNIPPKTQNQVKPTSSNKKKYFDFNEMSDVRVLLNIFLIGIIGGIILVSLILLTNS